ncbi:MAG: TPM domain-containing protein [Burkholderiales bacterium]
MRRLIKHLLFFPWRLRRIFTQPVLATIEREIGASEQRHTGQIRFAVEANFDLLSLLRGKTARARALEVFTRLRVWDTEQNNGVLIYLLLAERRVEIVADRGIDAKLDQARWLQICQRMQAAFRKGDFETGAREGIREISAHLAAHFPAAGGNANELPDQPVVL